MLGKLLIIIGIVLIIIGVLFRFTDISKYLFHLPGDIRIEKKNFGFYFPITSMIIISIIISIIIGLFKK
ncbi:MAG: DUF2905 domain-containing protein [Candidatus Cloacimonadota bacterium]|nr:MAG: DUF2905 domain-containing protein [Candidatus Cloacimonadota bacterium]